MTTTELTAESVSDGNGDAVRRVLNAGVALADPFQDSENTIDVDTLVHVVPDGHRVVVTDLVAQRLQYADRPQQKAGSYHVADLGSFQEYFDKHATNSAEIWVRTSGITAVLNAHAADQPAYEDHKVTLRLEHSPEWKAWTGISGKLLDQQTFAEFLEANAPNIMQPVMGEILEVAQSLEATTSVDFKSAYRNSDGQRAFRYEETTTAKAGQKGELEIPERLFLMLRVYTAATPRQVVARFRYRLQGDRLSLGVVIDQQDQILQSDLDALADDIAGHVKDRALVLVA